VPHPTPPNRRVARAGVASALIAAGVVALPSTPAAAISTDVVISEVYGGGGNSGADYTHDFIELYNAGATTVDLSSWSVQYASSSGTSWQRTNLSGSIAPGERYLVREAQGNGGSTPLPAPDATGSIAMSAGNGKVALVTSTTTLSGCAPSCPTAPSVKDFVGYGSANEYEGSGAAPGLSNTTSATRRGADTDDNAADFEETSPSPVSTTEGEEPPPPPPPVEGLEISDIQGAAHLSPYDGDDVAAVPGVVTARTRNGFWMQSESPDGDPATSEGVFVYTGSSPSVAVGDRVTVSGTVEEYRPGGGSSDNLTTTEISGSPQVTVLATDVPAPATTLVGRGGRVPPANVIDDDATGSVETSGTFDPTEDGIDFWESLEGMVVGIEDARATGPTSRFGELPVVAAGAEPSTARGGVYVSADDFNPERVLLDDALLDGMPAAHTGDTLTGTTVGVLDYSFANFKLLPWTEPTVVSGGIERETTTAAAKNQISIASYNVENLDPGDPQSQFDDLAAQIVDNLGSPDVVGLEEVQDNSGPTNDGTTAADQTLDLLTEAIAQAGGPSYDWRQIDPVNNAEGGQPGGNIRVAFLFRSDRGVQFVDRGTPTSSTDAEVVGSGEDTHLVTSPARVAPESPAWDDSRVPLVGEFTWKERTFFVVANHFSSKGGDDPLFGRWQPAQRSSEVKRHQQAREVRGFVDELLAADKNARVAVLGDINDFEFSETTDILVGDGATALTDLPRTLPENEQYTYVYEGNSQVLDHILLSPRFVKDTFAYDIVHVNAEFADQISDHDPQVVRLGNPNAFK
jgi:predicted extracellular nuclease